MCDLLHCSSTVQYSTFVSICDLWPRCVQLRFFYYMNGAPGVPDLGRMEVLLVHPGELNSTALSPISIWQLDPSHSPIVRRLSKPNR